MRKIRTIVVDDERIGRTRVRRMLEREPDFEVVAECADGPSAIAAVRAGDPDLVFLDINMPEMDGFEVLEELGARQRFQVIFVTSYDEHAVRAFEACALDYLLKPVSPERLQKTLERARARFADSPPRGTNPPLPEPAPATSKARYVVRSGGRLSFVSAGEIDWIEAAGNYAIFHVGRHNHMVRETMSSLETALAVEGFFRVSRSTILNLHRIKELHSTATGGHAALLEDGQRVAITRNFREVTERLAQL